MKVLYAHVPFLSAVQTLDIGDAEATRQLLLHMRVHTHTLACLYSEAQCCLWHTMLQKLILLQRRLEFENVFASHQSLMGYTKVTSTYTTPQDTTLWCSNKAAMDEKLLLREICWLLHKKKKIHLVTTCTGTHSITFYTFLQNCLSLSLSFKHFVLNLKAPTPKHCVPVQTTRLQHFDTSSKRGIAIVQYWAFLCLWTTERSVRLRLRSCMSGRTNETQ